MDFSGTQESQHANGNNRLWKPKSQGSNGQKPKEQRPNHEFQQRKTFEWTPQQQQWFRDGTCINCEKQSHYTRDCQQGQRTSIIKGTTAPKRTEKFKGTKGYTVKHFAFYYNNRCQVHEEAKYSASYWPQEPSPDKFKSIEEEDMQDRRHYGKDMHRNNEPKDPKRTANPYFSTSYNSFYDYNPEKETFSNTKDTQIRYFTEKAKRAAKSNMRTKNVPKIKITKPEIPETNLFVN